jgi:hypothetical protein
MRFRIPPGFTIGKSAYNAVAEKSSSQAMPDI